MTFFRGNKPIATGNWGCGVFNGIHQLKALIQLMSAAQGKNRKKQIKKTKNLRRESRRHERKRKKKIEKARKGKGRK